MRTHQRRVDKDNIAHASEDYKEDIMNCKYDVDVYELPFLTYSDIFSMKSGVYFLFAEKYGELLYIGQSKRLRHRISQHEKAFDDLWSYTYFLDRFVMGYKVIEVPVNELDNVERFFIDKYHPPMNYDKNGSQNRKSYQMWMWERMEEYDKAKRLKERLSTTHT